jgi:hypothetical protein
LAQTKWFNIGKNYDSEFILPNAPHALSNDPQNDKYGWLYFNEEEKTKFEDEFK